MAVVLMAESQEPRKEYSIDTFFYGLLRTFPFLAVVSKFVFPIR